ncbi:MAG: phosphatase PAP2 family protein [Bacteroidetes bacterium]|nr:MAG: phosphatase PAP2 family protein [Bacteroidota bacterium]
MTNDKLPMTVKLLFCLFVIIHGASARPDSTGRPFLPIVLSDTKQFFNDAGNFFSSPLHFSDNDWFAAGAIIGGTASLFLIDDEMRTVMKHNQTPFLDDLSDITRIYGESYFGVGLSAGIYSVGLFSKNTELRNTGLMVFESLAFSAAITHSLKIIIGRSRPYTENGNAAFSPFKFQEEHWSLPSGHATSAFAISSVLAGRFNNTYASIALYSLATLTAFSRVYSDVHWISDAALGSAIGYVTGNAVLQLHNKNKTESSFHFQPVLNGVRVDFRF